MQIGFSVWHQESLHQKLTVPVIVSGEKTSLARIVFQRLPFAIRQRKTKLEFLDSVLYQVFSKYVEIDGVPYVIEMLKKLDLETLIDKSESDKLVNQIFGLDDRIYRDVLTGAYNRRYYEKN